MTYSPTRLLLTGIAHLLAEHGVGVYKPNGAYDPDDTAIVMKTMPDRPDRCITLNWVPMGGDPSMPRISGLLQVACRGNPDQPLDCDDLADLCEAQLDGLTNLDLTGGATLIQCVLRNAVNMGQDDGKQWVTACQYDIDIDLPPTSLRPLMGAW